MERNLTYRYYYYFLTHASNPPQVCKPVPRVRVFLHDKSYLGRSAIHGKTHGKTAKTHKPILRVRVWWGYGFGYPDPYPTYPTCNPQRVSQPVIFPNQDDEIDLYSDELTEILADGPISHAKKPKVIEKEATVKCEVDDEDAGGVNKRLGIESYCLQRRLPKICTWPGENL